MERELNTAPEGDGMRLNTLIELMSRTQGLDIACFEKSFLAQSLEKRLAATPGIAPTAYLDRLSHDRAEAESFFDSLHITYSEFFRSPLAFALMAEDILPRLIETRVKEGRAELRVWSAGCSSGQEPWSIAMLLDELITSQDRPAAYRIIATDRSETSLTAARRGVYDKSAVENLRLCQARKYFSQTGDAYVVAPRLHEHVDFSVYDLLDQQSTSPSASIYGDFDLILCSNVLLYYRKETQRFILNKLHHCLSPQGFLITDRSEFGIVDSAGGWQAMTPPIAIFNKTQQNRRP